MGDIEGCAELASVIQNVAWDLAPGRCMVRGAHDEEAILSPDRTVFRFFETLETLKAYTVTFTMAATCRFVAVTSP